jgi:hypothetical protein
MVSLTLKGPTTYWKAKHSTTGDLERARGEGKSDKRSKKDDDKSIKNHHGGKKGGAKR